MWCIQDTNWSLGSEGFQKPQNVLSAPPLGSHSIICMPCHIMSQIVFKSTLDLCPSTISSPGGLIHIESTWAAHPEGLFCPLVSARPSYLDFKALPLNSNELYHLTAKTIFALPRAYKPSCWMYGLMFSRKPFGFNSLSWHLQDVTTNPNEFSEDNGDLQNIVDSHL